MDELEDQMRQLVKEAWARLKAEHGLPGIDTEVDPAILQFYDKNKLSLKSLIYEEMKLNQMGLTMFPPGKMIELEKE